MITDEFLNIVQSFLPDGFKVACGPDPFRLRLLTPGNPAVELILPDHWEIRAWNKGFGGWILNSLRDGVRGTEHFVRCKAAVANKHALIREVSLMRAQGVDMRSESAKSMILSFIAYDYTILSLEEQAAQYIADLLRGLEKSLKSVSEESILRYQALFRRDVNKFFLRFTMMPIPGQQRPFLQNSLTIDYEDYPSGAREIIRDATIEWLCSAPFRDLHSGTRFRCDPTATSKNTPGKWVSVVSTELNRQAEDKSTIVWTKLTVPVILAATQPVIGNRKRAPREMGGLKNALPLIDPQPIDVNLRNGFEAYLTAEMKECITRVCIAFATVEGVNFYQESIERTEDGINLDDILVTLDGHYNLTTHFNEKKVYMPDKWEQVKHLYESEEGVPNEGISIVKNLTQETSFKRIPLYSEEVVVTDKEKPEEWVVGKVLLDSTLKAMAKVVPHSLIGIDNQGVHHTIDVCVSPESIKEKKVESIVLSAILDRIGFGYISDPEACIDPRRQSSDPADKYPDLVQEASAILKAQGESQDGKIRVYRLDEGDWTYVGDAIVGYVRASRLQESERTSSRVRYQGAIPVQTPLRHLMRRPGVLDEDTEELINLTTDTYLALRALSDETSESVVEENLMAV